MLNDPPAPVHAAINPFAAALREGAALTYLAMLDAGLGSQFEPLPLNPQGHGFLSSILGNSTKEQGVELCARWTALSLDSTTLQQRPDWTSHGREWTAASQCLSGTHLPDTGLPLASLAIANGREHFASLWRDLSPAQLLSISESALPLAIYTDNLPALGALLAAGANPNMLDGAKAPLALRALNPDALCLLIDAGADLRARAPEGVYLNGRRVPPQGISVHESIMLGSSLGPKARALREVTLSWLQAHPLANDPDLELAQAAFEAIERESKEGTRACIESLGVRAAGRLDAEGNSLAIRCAEKGNFLEVGRLIKLGSKPFEIAPSGRSLWGEITRTFHKINPNTWKTAERTQLSRATKLLATIENHRVRSGGVIPWTLRSASGSTILETLIGTGPLAEFLARAETAFAAGLDPRAPLSDGMDLSGRLALHLALNSPWMGGSGSTEIKSKEANMAMEFLVLHPLSACSESVLAALARRFTQAICDQSLDGNHFIFVHQGGRTTIDKSLWVDDILRSFEALGVNTQEAPDWNLAFSGWPDTFKARVHSSFEKGQLRTQSERPNPLPLSTSMRRL